ncbi:MAG: ABC transporter permease subunit [Planctomycetota bacterium]
MKEIKKRTRRPRRTTRSVRVVDRIARTLITLGGFGTIAAVATLFVFLFSVVVPLFLAPEVGPPRATAPRSSPVTPIAAGTDEYLQLGWSAGAEGTFTSFALADGAVLAERRPFDGRAPTAFALHASEGTFVGGFADGSLQRGTITTATRTPSEEERAALADLPLGASRAAGTGLATRLGDGELRLQELELALEDPVAISAAPLALVDVIETSSGPIYASLDTGGRLRIARSVRKTNLLTGEETQRLLQGELALEFPPDAGAPRWLLLAGQGDNIFLLWEDGALWRCDTRDFQQLQVAEKTDLLPEEGLRATVAGFLIGRNSLVVGDALGRLRVWFRIKPADAGTSDGAVAALAHELGAEGSPALALAPSGRGRMLAVGYADGSAQLFHVTSGRRLAHLDATSDAGPVLAVRISPKDDALLCLGAQGGSLRRIEVPHPETDLASIFSPVWYEGYEAPEHVWQSSSGTDDFEPKYGLAPLVFGTIKATFYSLLFGVPIALLAAVYTSEFLHPRHKNKVKPTIEMMASLPSVVLGFLSALVIAPLIEDIVPGVLLSIAFLPVMVALGGYLWRAASSELRARFERLRLLLVLLCLVLAVLLGGLSGPLFERLFFEGDFRQWLTGSLGTATGGWVILLLPAVALALGFVLVQWVNPWLVARSRTLSSATFARREVVKFLAALGVGALALLGLASALAAFGFDPRGGLLDTYVQRNALVVGFVMGFAIIPIVYTISEDALAAVPDHLRAASLGAGATTWQTALRVVIPTAMSGIFSAIMIGFGRAVGETMIVLMAAGNTPIMDWNVFNGFRTLSANIAVELPEAAQGSTHYRMLFLAALVLFGMTFVLNTVAEAVRMRYRKRRVQL